MEPIDVVRAWAESRINGATHWEGCWTVHPACAALMVLAERDALRAGAQKWAVYAFNHHGDDSTLYNGLATLGGVSEDGEGWLPDIWRKLSKLGTGEV